MQQPNLQEQPSSMWRILGIGVVLMLILVAAIVLLNRGHGAPVPAATDPYAANLQVANLKMSAAENFVGATVTYVDGTLTNSGTKTVTGARMEATFRSSLGELAQREEIPVQVLKTGGPYPEAVDLKASPLMPGQSITFRLTFEHVSAEWNQAYPELRFTRVATQ